MTEDRCTWVRILPGLYPEPGTRVDSGRLVGHGLAVQRLPEVMYRIGVWRSLVAHSLWERGVASSNLVTPTHVATRRVLGLTL
jgi:hypothetical protein